MIPKEILLSPGAVVQCVNAIFEDRLPVESCPAACILYDSVMESGMNIQRLRRGVGFSSKTTGTVDWYYYRIDVRYPENLPNSWLQVLMFLSHIEHLLPHIDPGIPEC